MKSNNKREEILENVQRVVVKVGTSTLTTEDGRLNIDKTKLQKQLKDAETKQEADYTPNTWNEFKKAKIRDMT